MSQGFKEISRRAIGVPIGLQAWRNIAIGISRRYLRPEYIFQPDEEDKEGGFTED